MPALSPYQWYLVTTGFGQREVCQVFLQALGHGREGRERQSSRDDCTDYRNGFCCSLSEALFRHAEAEVSGDLFRVKRQKRACGRNLGGFPV